MQVTTVFFGKWLHFCKTWLLDPAQGAIRGINEPGMGVGNAGPPAPCRESESRFILKVDAVRRIVPITVRQPQGKEM